MKHGSLLLLSILICHTLRGALPQHSISPSRQFVIYGANTAVRGAVSEIAERTKENLLSLLQQPDRWKTTIVVNLQSPQANIPELPQAELRFSQTGFGLKLQLDLTIANQSDRSLVERELLRAILLEMIYRREANIAPGTAFSEPPDWLLDGILALRPGYERQSLVEALNLSAKVTPLEDFLRQRPALLDSPGRLLYRAHSFALVQLLSGGTDRASRLARYIDNLSHASNDPLADLKTQFPFLRDNGKEAWESSIRRLRTSQNSQLLGFEETNQQLRKLLLIKTPGSEAPPTELSDFSNRKLSSLEKAVINQLSQELLLLGTRANPALRPMVMEFQQIAALLAAGKQRKLARRLTHAKSTHAELVSRMSEIGDYLNWFEATQSQAKSEMFADYLSAVSESAPRRRDALSVYLDSLESQF